MDGKMTMDDRVLKYMQDFGGITSWEAISELGYTRLSASIYNLRRYYQIEDRWIKKKNRYGDNVKFKQYYIVKKY